jgi:ligand-binding sensor domain-containing protein
LAAIVLAAFDAVADPTQHWQQYRAFGGRTMAGDIKSIVCDARYVYAFSNSSGARYDRLLNEWEFSIPPSVPTGGFSFAALDHLTGDIYFAQGFRLIPYGTLAKRYFREITLPAQILEVSFDGSGVWVRTPKGVYLCDRWNKKVVAASDSGRYLEWFSSLDLRQLKQDSRFLGLSPYYQMDNWALVHPITGLCQERTNSMVWVSYSGLGLWQYDVYSRALKQVTRGFLASVSVSAMASIRGSLIMAGQGGLTMVATDNNCWQQWDRLFNLDLTEYQLRALAIDDKEIFMGTDNGILILKAGSDFAGNISSYEGLSYDKINTLWIQDDSLWIGTDYGLSLYLRRSRTVLNLWPVLEKYKIQGISGDGGSIYLATDHGGIKLDKADSLKPSLFGGKTPGEMEDELVAVQAQDSLVWWLGRDCLMSFNLHSRQWERYPRSGNYSAGQGQCLALDSDNVWIGTDNGLARFIKGQARFEVYHTPQGLLDEQVWAVCSLNGQLWAGGPSGASRFDWRDEGR